MNLPHLCVCYKEAKVIGVYILYGNEEGKSGFLFSVDARTAEVITRTGIIRVDRAQIKPLDIANSFDDVDALVEKIIQSPMSV